MKNWFFALLLCLFMMPVLGNAQGCSLCTKTASQLGEKGAKGLNKGIIYLAAIPLAIMGTLGFIWYRHQ